MVNEFTHVESWNAVRPWPEITGGNVAETDFVRRIGVSVGEKRTSL